MHLEYSRKLFRQLQNRLMVDGFVFSSQVHGTDGQYVSSLSTQKSFFKLTTSGDFLYTDKKGIGMGVLTADCLPIICYDSAKHVALIVHAGWRGSMASIAVKALDVLKQRFGSRIEDLIIHFGPCAKVCCYEVAEDFAQEECKTSQLVAHAFKERDSQVFFDVPFFNKMQLMSCGVEEQQINLVHNVCTICNAQYCSYRRTQNRVRQISVIVLQ